MNETARQGVLLVLAAEAILPALRGCAEILRGGATTSGLVERGITLFGSHIAARWHHWARGRSNDERRAALNELTALSQEEARRGAADALACLAPDARAQDRVAASAYLAAIPRTVDRVWQDDNPTSPWSPGTVSWEQPRDLLHVLPLDAPPYNAPCDLPGTPYRLEQLLGVGGFGAVYRAAAPALQHLPLAVKFCLDPVLAPALHQERSNLERLMQAGRDAGAQRIVRLYGYDFAHTTPYLVYEYVPGGDLERHVRGRRRLKGRPLNAAEVLGIIRQVAEGLAFAHRHALVHRDLKPANILVDGRLLKLADFGIGGAATVRAALAGEDGGVAHAAGFRAAGTPLYMSPEQRLGAAPDPRHDLYSLGVMWHQMLADDFSRALQPGWAKELVVRFEAPRGQVKLIERCVARFEDRPRDAAELSDLLDALPEEVRVTPPPIPPLPSTEVTPVRRTPPPTAPQEVRLLDRLTGLVRGMRRESDIVPRPPTPPRAEAPPGRRAECAELLRRLLRAHSDAARRSARPGEVGTAVAGLAAGGLAGWLADEVVYTIQCPQCGFFNLFGGGPIDRGAVLTGVAVGVVVYALVWLARQQIWRRRQRLAQAGVMAAARGLAERFPDEVRAWGGDAVLHDAAHLARLLHTLEAESPP